MTVERARSQVSGRGSARQGTEPESGVGVSVLLRQAHGFEGCCPIPVVLVTHHQAVSDSRDAGHLSAHGQAIAPASVEREVREDSLASVTQLVNLDRERLPGLSEVLPEPFEAVVAVIDGIKAGKQTRSHILEVAMKNGQYGVHVASVPRFDPPAHQLHVLLRHRPRSIPQAQEAPPDDHGTCAGRYGPRGGDGPRCCSHRDRRGLPLTLCTGYEDSA